jgi:bacterioferritin (cytochrome b1)
VDETRSKQQCELLVKVWDTINEVATALKERGLTLPAEIETSLQSTRKLLDMCRNRPRLSELTSQEIDDYLGFCVGCCGQDVMTRIKCELRTVEDRLIVQAVNDLGTETATALQQKTMRAWEDLRERIITGIETLTHAVKVERDVVSGYQTIVQDNISHWLGVERDLAESYNKMMKNAESTKTRATFAEMIRDTENHIEALESIRESFKKIQSDVEEHARVLEGLEKK